MQQDPRNMEYLVRDESETHGPWTYSEIEFKIRMKEIPDACQYRTTFDSEWKPVSELKKIVGEEERDELGGLGFKKTDGIFLLGLLMFFVGAVLFFFNPYLGDAVLVLSLVTEVAPIIYSIKNEPKAITKMVGNILALCWSAFQLLITIGFFIATFS